ncbi:hypothetical protein HQ47_10955 [Porphyromonas macacae]|nr:hypothetical protein HQ47_10955 [Porphyromonas macacae]
MGSLFHGKNGRGGENENHLKSISTRSGHTIELDDDKGGNWGITIKDAEGNMIRLDTKGKNIEITAPETISIKSKNLDILATERIDVHSKLMNTELSELMQVQTRESLVEIKETHTFRAQKADILGEQVQIQSSKENLVLSSGKEVQTNSKSKKIKLS